MTGENPGDQAALLLKEANEKLTVANEANAKLEQSAIALTKDVKVLEDAKNKAEDQVTALKQEVEVLNAVNDELSAKLAEVGSFEKTIEDHAKEVAAQKAPVVPTESFSVEGKEYVFIAPVFTHNHQRVTAEAALRDEALLAHLVKIQSGLVKEK